MSTMRSPAHEDLHVHDHRDEAHWIAVAARSAFLRFTVTLRKVCGAG
jgi:hypothetical protein